MYWDINRSLSYNCLFNFIVGARGVGKTYGAKRWAIKDYLKTGNQFVYVRRYKDELKKIKKFFDDIKDEFPDVEFKVSPPNFLINDQVAGTAIALSTAKIEKSTPYPNVTKIIFDEFILDKGFHRYIPDEVTNFLELYSTVARSRDVRVFFLSNALTITNPYFIYFNLSLPYGSNIKAQNDILLEMVEESDYEEMMSKTRFANLIKDTPYGNYAIKNQFLRDDNNFIMKKTPGADFTFGMIYKGEKYGVWTDYNEGLQFVSKDIDPSSKVIYSVTMSDHTPNTMLLKSSKSILMQRFIKNYGLGLVRFESVQIKNMCNDIIKMSL
jgi:hypothetical protein